MKANKYIIMLLVLFFAINSEAHQNKYRYSKGVNFYYFYSTLSPMGEWIEIDYDVYAWRPYNVRYNWQPYSKGRWAWTRDGWYWDSYEPFGWVTYHYGRWMYDDYYGWMWVPGYEWAPAWVEWRYDNHHVGWAPLSPYADYRFDVGIRFSIDWHTPHHHWNFVRYNHFTSYDIHYHFIDHNRSRGFFSNTKYRTNYYNERGRIVNGGVPRDFVENRIGRRIVERDVTIYRDRNEYNNRRNKDRDAIGVYRPTDRDLKDFRNPDRVVVKRDRRTNINTERFATGRNNRNDVRVERYDGGSRTSIEPKRTNPDREYNGNIDRREDRYENNRSVDPKINRDVHTPVRKRVEPRSENRSDKRNYDPPKTTPKKRDITKPKSRSDNPKRNVSKSNSSSRQKATSRTNNKTPQKNRNRG